MQTESLVNSNGAASEWTVPNEMPSYQRLYLLLWNFCLNINKHNLFVFGLLY